MSTTLWADRASFDNWRTSQQFKNAHGAGAGDKKEGGSEKPSHGHGAGKPGGHGAGSMGMMQGPPQVACFEGVLMLESPQGA